MKTVVHSVALAVLLVLGVGGGRLGAARGAEEDAKLAADATAGIKVVPAALKRAGDPFDLVFSKVQQARYVRFKIHANFGNDEYGSFVGLNEVRFLSSDKPLPGSIKATASSAFRADQTPTKTVDGSGVSDATPSTDYRDMWSTANNDVANAWIQFDLGSERQFDAVRIWNYSQIWNDQDLSNRGIRQADVLLSTDGLTWKLVAPKVPFPASAPAP
ncbi:MAG: discoidin domain-containing protein, partial [Pirellulaceae bacterium]|nr:discoidin domain-containing protein [Pirellulaceae bacterium]